MQKDENRQKLNHLLSIDYSYACFSWMAVEFFLVLFCYKLLQGGFVYFVTVCYSGEVIDVHFVTFCYRYFIAH